MGLALAEETASALSNLRSQQRLAKHMVAPVALGEKVLVRAESEVDALLCASKLVHRDILAVFVTAR